MINCYLLSNHIAHLLHHPFLTAVPSETAHDKKWFTLKGRAKRDLEDTVKRATFTLNCAGSLLDNELNFQNSRNFFLKKVKITLKWRVYTLPWRGFSRGTLAF